MITSTNSVARRPLALRSLTVAEIMTPNPLAFPKHLPVQNVAGLLQRNGLESAPIIDEYGRPLGLVTSASCAAWEEFSLRSNPIGFAREDLGSTPVREISSSKVETIHESATAREAIDRLAERRVRRIYVVDDRRVLVGVVSRADLLRHLTGRPDRPPM